MLRFKGTKEGRWNTTGLGLVDLDIWFYSAKVCPTLCDPMNCSPLGFLPDFPGKNTGVGCHFLLWESS